MMMKASGFMISINHGAESRALSVLNRRSRVEADAEAVTRISKSTEIDCF